MKFRFVSAVVLAGCLSASNLCGAPSRAAAEDVGVDAALGAAAGSIVAALLFDSHRDRYYYYDGDAPVYLEPSVCQQYFYNADPYFWSANSYLFYSSGLEFINLWRFRHPYHAWHHSYGYGYHPYYGYGYGYDRPYYAHGYGYNRPYYGYNGYGHAWNHGYSHNDYTGGYARPNYGYHPSYSTPSYGYRPTYGYGSSYGRRYTMPVARTSYGASNYENNGAALSAHGGYSAYPRGGSASYTHSGYSSHTYSSHAYSGGYRRF